VRSPCKYKLWLHYRRNSLSYSSMTCVGLGMDLPRLPRTQHLLFYFLLETWGNKKFRTEHAKPTFPITIHRSLSCWSVTVITVILLIWRTYSSTDFVHVNFVGYNLKFSRRHYVSNCRNTNSILCIMCSCVYSLRTKFHVYLVRSKSFGAIFFL
jgi:hypothetical protein